jgi:glycerol-3-phosphate dehydrogenase
LSVFLAEKHDFAYGTTFRSTKLIHGGLRYLEHYEIGLVRESLREREILMRTAPHLVRPIQFVIPIFSDNEYGYGKVKLGLMAYDILSYDKSLENHEAFNCAELLELEPDLRYEHCRGGFTYFDCQVPYPERLCLENILAAKKAGAEVHNYTRVIGFTGDEAHVKGVIARDVITNDVFQVSGDFIINASGPWVDDVLNLKWPASSKKIGGTKGSHILLPRFERGPRHAVYVPAHQDGRPFFIIPWRNCYWVGTTDIRYDGDLDQVRADDDEVEYLLREVNFVFPAANVGRQHIIYKLAGVRPLPKTKGETEEADITRRHLIYNHDDEGVEGLISVIGGKLTTYRNLAEETVDTVLRELDRSAPECKTKELPLPGGEELSNVAEYVEEQKANKDGSGLDEEQIEYLISLYGVKYRQVTALLRRYPDLAERIVEEAPDIQAQVIYSAQNEFPKTLADIYIRRMGLGTGALVRPAGIEKGARLLGKYYGWNRQRVRSEIEKYEEEIDLLFGSANMES